MISLIVARAANGAIGKDGDIPWHAPEDLAFFQRETIGGAIIMGRNTWDSLPYKPLKGRLNILVTSRDCGAAHQVSSVSQALEMAHAQGYSRIYGIGGAGIYRAMLPIADRLLITEVALQVADADTFFPRLEAAEWCKTGAIPLRAADPACRVDEYLRAPAGAARN